MNRIQIVAAAAGGFFFFWFAAPLLVRGILNIGNATGMVLFGALFFYGLFMDRVHAAVLGVWKNRVGKAALVLAILLAAGIVLLAAAESALMVRAALRHPPANTTAIVLGCSVKGTSPSMILQERLDAALAYLTENRDAVCILSGGQGEGEDISEAECMYRYLTEMGIDGERLIREDASVNTEENLRYSGEILNKRGLGDTVTIITSEFHAYRAAATAEKLGLNAYSTPSRTFFAFFPTYYVRELYGILYYQMKVKVL